MAVSKIWHLWVLRTVKKYPVLFTGRHFGGERQLYFASRTSLENPRYLTEFGDKVKYFATKDKALDYYMAKSQCCKTETCNAVRIKVYVSYHNQYQWLPNSRAWKRRELADSRRERT